MIQEPKKSIDCSISLGEFNKTSRKAPPLSLVVIIILVAFSVYFNALFNDFVYDDLLQIVDNEWIKDIQHLPEFFTANTWAFTQKMSNYYRPLLNTIYMLNYQIFGLKPLGFHLVNILFHAGVSVMVFFIVSSLLSEILSLRRTFSLSFIAALLFATHPIHTESVAWVAGITDLSYSFFYLSSFYLYMRSTAKDHQWNVMYILSVASFILAVLAKEPALTLPAVIVAYDVIIRNEPVRVRESLRRYVPYLIVAGAYLIAREHALGSFAPFVRHSELSTYQYFINMFPLFVKYIQKLVIPVNLNAFYELHPLGSILEPKGIISLFLTCVCIIAAFITFKKNRLAFLALVFIIVPLLPALYIPALGPNTFAERYLYLPSFGFVLILVLLINEVWQKKPGWTKVLVGVTVTMLGLYSLGVIERNTVWKDNYTLWEDTLKKSPDAAIPRANFADALLHDRGRTDEAIDQLKIALQSMPFDPGIHHNLGIAYSRKGLDDEAIEQLEMAIRGNTRNVRAHRDLGNAYIKIGQLDRAIIEFQTVLKMEPNDYEVRYNLGIAYGSKGWLDLAIEQYQDAVQLKPDYADAHNNLGIAYGKKGFLDKAIEQFQEALRVNPSDSAYRANLAHAYELRDRHDKAEEHRRLARNPEKQ